LRLILQMMTNCGEKQESKFSAHFPNDFLLKNNQEIVGFYFSEYKKVKEAIQSAVERLFKLEWAFKENLLQVLSEAADYEGLHENSYPLLTAYFKRRLTSL
jgi:hypothetical protein